MLNVLNLYYFVLELVSTLNLLFNIVMLSSKASSILNSDLFPQKFTVGHIYNSFCSLGHLTKQNIPSLQSCNWSEILQQKAEEVVLISSRSADRSWCIPTCVLSPVPQQHTAWPGLTGSPSWQYDNSCKPSHSAEPGGTGQPSSWSAVLGLLGDIWYDRKEGSRALHTIYRVLHGFHLREWSALQWSLQKATCALWFTDALLWSFSSTKPLLCCSEQRPTQALPGY